MARNTKRHRVESKDGEADSSPSRRRFLRVAGTATAVGATGLSGCLGGGDGDSTGVQGTVTYGVLNPISGAYSSLGPGQRQGAELAIKQINEGDEFEFEVEATYEDTQTDVTTGQQVAQKAIEQDGAQYLVGAINSSVGLALNEVARRTGTIYNACPAAVSITGSDCNEYVFRGESNTAMLAEAVSDYTVQNLGTNVWFHVANYAYGNSVLNRVRSRMQESDANVNVVDVTKSELGANNYDSYISQISNSNADVVVIGMTGGDLITFVNQAAGQGLKDQVNLMSPTMTFQVVRGALGEAAYGTYGGVRYLPSLDTGTNPQFVEAYRNEYDGPPENFARVAYMNIMMTARGIQEAGSTDPEDVKDALPGLEMETIIGQNQYRECDHQALSPVWMGQNVAPESGDMADVELLNEVDGADAALPCEETGCEM